LDTQLKEKTQKFIKIIQEMLDEAGTELLSPHLYAITIPGKKLSNMRKSMSIPADDQVFILVDDTVFGSAKDGMAITSWGLWHKAIAEEPWKLSWETISSKYFIGDCIKTALSQSLFLRNGQGDDYTIEKKIIVTQGADIHLIKRIIKFAVEIFGSKNISPTVEKQTGKKEKTGTKIGVKNITSPSGKMKQDPGEVKKPPLTQRAKPKEQKPVKESNDEDPDVIDSVTISEKIYIVYDKDTATAQILFSKIKQISTVEPELQTKVEYEAARFAEELIGEENNKTIIFAGMVPDIPENISWKDGGNGLKYGWKNKTAVLLAEETGMSPEEAVDLFCKKGLPSFIAGY
jgi:hypothetical protein